MLLISTGIAGVSTEKPVSPYEIISKSLQKETVSEPNQNITVSELLNKYTKVLDSTVSFIASSESVEEYSYYIPEVPVKMTGAKLFRREHTRSDGRRFYLQEYKWGDINSKTRNLPEKNPHYICRVVDEKKFYQNTRLLNEPRSKGQATHSFEGTEKGILSLNTDSHILGFIGSHERLDAVLRESKQISVRPTTETINGSNCYVIDAQTKYGKYSLWLDPGHGYHPAKINYKAVEGDEYYDKGKLEKGNSRTAYLDNVRFEKIDGVWIPMEADSGYDNNYGQGYFSKNDLHFKRTKIILNPDHDAFCSFDDPLENPKQDPELINGTHIILNGLGNIRYTWENGKVVDDYGHEVDPENLGPTSLVGKALPDFAQFDVTLDSDAMKNKMLLICFWDMEQRPSRNAILTLNKRAQTLLDENNVYMVFIHAGSVEEQAFVSWLKQNQIQPPVGVSITALPELGYTWGVQSLPWLILTDKNHIVRAEGFSYNELNEKIKEIENAKD